MNKILHTSIAFFICFGCVWNYSFADDKDDEKTVNKNITIISGQSSADGKSTVHKEILEECIESLPSASNLQAQVTSEQLYLKELNGESGKNGYVKVFTATIEINYLVFQKELIIITTNSIQKQEPVTKTVDKQLREKQIFKSDPSETGQVFAGLSKKTYYFTSPEAATEDVKKRAEIWLGQQASIVCKNSKK